MRQMRVLMRDRLTPTGRLAFYLMILGAGVGGVSLVIKTYLVGVTLFCLLFTSVVSARLARVRLKLRLEIPGRVTRAVPFQARVLLQNPTKKVARDVQMRFLQLPPSCEVHPVIDGIAQTGSPGEYLEGLNLGDVDPDKHKIATWEILARKRGSYDLAGLRQATLFPFGLWRDWYDHPLPEAFLVYPSFTTLESLDIPVGRRYQPGGIALSSNLGDSTEFISTREFREGDSLRMIHWRSWARTGKPVVKEFQEEFFCRVAVVLDTFLSKESLKTREDEFESVISLAAAVADHLAREEYVIDLFAAGPELYQLQAGRSLAHFDNVMDILACVEPCSDPAFEKIEPVLLDSMENITTTVVILLDWSDARERLIQSILARGSGVKVILVGEKLAPERAAYLESLTGSFVWLTQDLLRAGVTQL